MESFSAEELDLLLYIVTYQSVFRSPPPKREVMAKAGDTRVVRNLLQREYLQEQDGYLVLVQERLMEPVPG